MSKRNDFFPGMYRRTFLVAIGAAVTTAAACSSENGDGQTTSTGGTIVSTGGALSTSGGNTTATGGTPSSGGITVNTGGLLASGGVVEGTGGEVTGSGGDVTTTGGQVGTGGETSTEMRTRTIETRGFTFDAREIGSTGEPVLLLHGFPETSLMWTGLMPVLASNGYHCLAPDQRGYSPGARPTEVDAYRYEELVADAFALGSELGDRFHLVAHDWGANVGWLMLEEDPSRIASFTAISIPHYRVWARSVYDDPEMASYLSMLNTWMTPDEGEAVWTPDLMRTIWSSKPADQTEQTIAHMMEPGAMTAALNWYRASEGHRRAFEDYEVWTVGVPTLLIHGSTDLGEAAVADTAALMTGSYRVVRPDGAHFIVDEQPQIIADETLAQLQANPIM